jgi:sarcosine oxidase
VQTRRIHLSWFAARDPEEFVPERFPIFVRVTGQRSLYGAPTIDGASVKARLNGRAQPASDADSVDRALSPTEIAESEKTVAQFLPGLIPYIVRSDA